MADNKTNGQGEVRPTVEDRRRGGGEGREGEELLIFRRGLWTTDEDGAKKGLGGGRHRQDNQSGWPCPGKNILVHRNRRYENRRVGMKGSRVGRGHVMVDFEEGR